MRLPLWAYRWLHRRSISRPRLRGGFLHNRLGDRLLDKSLWMPTRVSLARAWLLGIPVTTVPFLPAQTLFAAVLAIACRANVLLSIALQFLSSPVTAPVQLSACYFTGRVLQGESPASAWAHLLAKPEIVFSKQAVFSLYLGAAVVGPLLGVIGYAIIMLFWPDRSHPLRERHLLPERPTQPENPSHPPRPRQ